MEDQEEGGGRLQGGAATGQGGDFSEIPLRQMGQISREKSLERKNWNPVLNVSLPPFKFKALMLISGMTSMT